MIDRQPPPPPAPPVDTSTQTKRAAGLFLGIAGMAVYCGGVQLAGRSEWTNVSGVPRLWQIGPVIAAVGCMMFCAAVALIWRMSLKGLIVLILCAGMMIWGASQIGMKTGGRSGALRMNRLLHPEFSSASSSP